MHTNYSEKCLHSQEKLCIFVWLRVKLSALRISSFRLNSLLGSKSGNLNHLTAGVNSSGGGSVQLSRQSASV